MFNTATVQSAVITLIKHFNFEVRDTVMQQELPIAGVGSDTTVAGHELKDGVALALSGGGYRAMLFHVGAIIRLNEFGILKKLKAVSSVSGGSMTSCVLAMNWEKLEFNADGVAVNLRELMLEPIRTLADTTIDEGSVIGGILLPGSVNDFVVSRLNEILFQNRTLQDLVDPAVGPQFTFNATSVQTGALVRMSKAFLADYHVGSIPKPRIPLARVVAASAAFPPFLSPAKIDVDPSDFKTFGNEDLNDERFTDTMVLTDGGVYDNLGLETLWKNYKTILVSDGGGKMKPDPNPAGDWAQHSKRILDLVDNQVRSLRKRYLIDSFESALRDGAYWGIRSDIADYNLDTSFKVPKEESTAIADTPTRLKKLPADRQKKIMNWGYAVCDAAIRKHAPQLQRQGAPEKSYPF